MVLAVRTYYDGLKDILDASQCRFDNVPLPGYGWIFPVCSNSINIGIGLFREGIASWWMPKTAHAAFDTFIKSPQIQELLDGGNQIGPLNLMVRAIARNEDLMDLFMDIAIENQNISRRLAPSTIAKVIFEGKPGR